MQTNRSSCQRLGRRAESAGIGLTFDHPKFDRDEMGSRRRSTKRDNANTNPRGVDAAMSASRHSDDPSKPQRNPRKRRTARRRLIFESLGQRRLLAVITGSVFHDADGSMRPDAGEVRLESRLAYIDANDNASLDVDETFAIADENGQFRFDDLATGSYAIRLFDGSAGQRQTFPTGLKQSALPTSFEDPIDAVLAGNQLNILAENTLLQVETSGTRTSQFSLDFDATRLITSIAAGPQGASASVIAGTFTEVDQERSGLWLVPAGVDRPRLIQYAANPLAFAAPAAAVGDDGNGVIIQAGESLDAEATIHAIRITPNESGNTFADSIHVQVNSTRINVPADTQVLSSGTALDLSSAGQSGVGSRSVIAWPIDTTTTAAPSASQTTPALRASLWSNNAANWIAGSETVIVGATELIGFDDAAGLLAVRYAGGGLGILDVDAGFAQLHQFTSLQGPASFVPKADAIASVVPGNDGYSLLLHDIRDGQLLADHAIDVESIGSPVAIIPGPSINAYYVLGDVGAASIQLNRPTAHHVVLDRSDAEVTVEFGVQVESGNVLPSVQSEVTAGGNEDSVFRFSASQIAGLVADADRDRLISLITQEPEHGSVTADVNGGLKYRPLPNYNGTDSFAIQFHDGQSASQPIQFNLSIASLPDTPSGIRLIGDAIPEHTEGRYEVGAIEVLDPDGDAGAEYEMQVYDSRFRIEDGTLILVNGGLDYEYEPEILLTISGYDTEAGDYFSDDVVVYVEDENDPVQGLAAYVEYVYENEEGSTVGTVSAFDPDLGQTVTFSVDDDRFEIVGTELRLKSGESVDYEAESVVVLTVTADDQAGGAVSIEVRVPVLDVPEAISEITLSNQTVRELESGATVGEVRLDGVPAADSYQLTVDDPRFEIDGSTLKLLDDQFVRRSAAEQIELTITAQDTSATFDAISATFVIDVLENETPFHNDDNPYDVDGNGTVSPLDALAIINYLNLYGPGPVGPGDPGFGYDVNGDGQVTALDALLVINRLNFLQRRGMVGGGGLHNSAPDGDGSAKSGETTPDTTDSGASQNGPTQSGTSSLDPEPPQSSSGQSTSDLLRTIQSHGLVGPVNDAPLGNSAAASDALAADSTDLLNLSPQEIDEVAVRLEEIRNENDDRELDQAIDELLALLSQAKLSNQGR